MALRGCAYLAAARDSYAVIQIFALSFPPFYPVIPAFLPVIPAKAGIHKPIIPYPRPPIYSTIALH